MHSFILSHYSQAATITKICKIAKIDLSVERFNQHPDIYHIHPQVNEKTVLQKQSIKIEQIRELKTNFNKKPMMLPKQIAIIWQAQFLTLSASNALLKLLEEPTTQSLIFLITDNYQHLLPTIQSRCQIIKATNHQQPTTDNLLNIDLKSLYQAEKGERMGMMATACTNQQEALAWLQSLMYSARSKLAKSSPKGMKSLATLLENTQTIYNDIGIYNVNWKLALDMLGLWWDKKIN